MKGAREMQKVYILTSGEYSDYSIEATFSTKEKAEAFAKELRKRCRWRAPEIEEWELDRPSTAWWTSEVRMDKHGNVEDVSLGFMEKRGIYFTERLVARAAKNGHPRPPGKVTFLVGIVGTKEIKRAVKVVNERRTQILAANLWGDNVGIKALFGEED